jgi:pimeloyl-ACP methyl ester carboxylesterase
MTGHGFDASGETVGTAGERDRRIRAMSEQPTVVLVHGAWHGAWCWDAVVDRLGGDGLAVVAVDLPSVVSGGDLYDDARAVREVLDDTPGDKVVVGHSYGGIVITEAAAGADGVRHLVYLTAFMLDQGQSLADIAGRNPPDWQIPAPDGKTLTVDGPQQVFYNTCSPAVADAAAARLRPQTTASFVEPVRSVAWRDVPSTYVICDQDHAIPVAAQEAMSAHAGATHHLDSDHSPFLTDPEAVADLIRAVAHKRPER